MVAKSVVLQNLKKSDILCCSKYENLHMKTVLFVCVSA